VSGAQKSTGVQVAVNTVDHNTWLGNPKLNPWAVLVEASWRQVGYVMVLYLAGLKAVDPSLREAALIDGANPWQNFWRVVFPTMRPINIIAALTDASILVSDSGLAPEAR
jgi:ABC-type sugar transport system permease subunit